MADRVLQGDVIAFRLGAHQLTERLGASGILAASGRCGIQNSPPGSALLALHARVRDLTPEQMSDAVAREKSLLQSWCMRGSPFYFPASDAPVFTTGVLPPTEEGMRHLVLGVEQALDKLGMRLTNAVELTGAEIRAVLSGRRLAISAAGGGDCVADFPQTAEATTRRLGGRGSLRAGAIARRGRRTFLRPHSRLAAGGLLCATGREHSPVRPRRRVAGPSDPRPRPGPRARRTASPLSALLRTVDSAGTSLRGWESMPVIPTPGGARLSPS